MKKCIFILEDDDDLRELITYMLEDELFQVKAYSTATSFKNSLASELPDIILMDVRLPDGNGMEICEDIKANEKTTNIPVIMMSAHHHFLDAGKTSRAQAFISKPFDIQNFIQTIKQYA